MSTRQSIEISVSQAREQANSLFGVSSEINNVRAQLEEVKTFLQGSWYGDGCGLLCSKLDILAANLSILSNDCVNVGNAINSSAQYYYDTGMMEIELIEQREREAAAAAAAASAP